MESILAKQANRMVVISGGEPFEHPGISSLLKTLQNHSGLFRIATGGFVSFAPWENALAELQTNSTLFQGISLGTDVLSSRVNDPALASTWFENLKLLQVRKISYSITVTLGDGIGVATLSILKQRGAEPQFFYLRFTKGAQAAKIEWEQSCRALFPNTEILIDCLD